MSSPTSGLTPEDFGSRTVTVLLDEAPESWRALLSAVAEAGREGRDLRAILLDLPPWVVFATICPFYLETAGGLAAAKRDLRDEYDAALRAHGFGPTLVVTSRRELVRHLMGSPAHRIVAGMQRGHAFRSALGGLGQPTLLVP
ncbi:hypothetical protein GHK92_17260 [Nocardioides sp. dk4132]|uniref:hypothetical protein n=1 Tax=unclassified Nocardioides TaxID=2615069 RepID=UPI001295B6E4|nr:MULTISPECIES: hypothetical protein [unclassified Nocardioides]MQW77623.1 hypothetical protein [Nocardioides sp. dk4132]QGA06149.1 hypothetical protein GFH29_01120 [Nocardioides sp. dk884]